MTDLWCRYFVLTADLPSNDVLTDVIARFLCGGASMPVMGGAF